MAYRIVPRHQIGLPHRVTNTNGRPRPELHNEPIITVHYTGVSSRGYTHADVAAEVRRIQQAFSRTKPFEYNYVIGQTNDDAIYEFAGTYQAAHSAGENHMAFGVLFLNAVDEPFNCVQQAKFQWLRDVLIWVGELAPNPQQLPHNEMHGARTACPGVFGRRAMNTLRLPYSGS